MSRPRVLYDISVLAMSRAHRSAQTGVYRVAERVLSGLAAREDLELCVCCAGDAALAAHADAWLQARPDLAHLQRADAAAPCDIYHSPYYAIPSGVQAQVRFLTVVDLIPLRYPELVDGGGPIASNLLGALRSIGSHDWALCISQHVADEYCEFLKHDPGRVAVTPLAADPALFYPCNDAARIEAVRRKLGIPGGNYLLSVSNLEPRKNVAHVIGAFARLAESGRMEGTNLVLVNASGADPARVRQVIEQHPRAAGRILVTGFVEDRDLAPLYGGADCFVYMSRAEGFGLPPLEAMQCGVPVIASKATALPEVLGEAAILLDPDDLDGLCDAMARLAGDREARAAWSARGLERSRHFSWEDCVARTAAAYHEALAVHARSARPGAPAEKTSPAEEVAPQEEPATIVIDGVFFQLWTTGIRRVWESLLAAWAKDGFLRQLLFLDRGGTAPAIEGLRCLRTPTLNRADPAADRAMLQAICDRVGARLFVSTYYTTPIATPSVFFAYDMIPEALGADLSEPMWVEKRRAIETACANVAISEHTARDLARFYPAAAANPVTVAHCGVGEAFAPATPAEVEDFRRRHGIARPYFLVCGERTGYKNVGLFFAAFTDLPGREKYQVVCAGGAAALEPALAAAIDEGQAYVARFSDADLRLAYAGALALVHPSRYEGFGMPVVEAMACACPVIATRGGAVPEVAGEAALYAGTRDEMQRALREVQRPQARARLVKAGLARAAGFSWARMAAEVREAFEAAAARAGAQDSAARSLQLAEHLLREERFEQAAGCCLQVLKDDPGNAEALHCFGIILYRMGSTESAIGYLESAVQARPGYGEALANLGQMCAALGRNAEALAWYEQALAADPASAVAREGRARLAGLV